MAGKQESKYKENEVNFDHHINEEQKQELMGLAMTFVTSSFYPSILKSITSIIGTHRS